MYRDEKGGKSAEFSPQQVCLSSTDKVNPSDPQAKAVICNPVLWFILLLFLCLVVSLIYESLVFSLISGIALCLLVLIEVTWGYISRKMLFQISMFCHYVSKNKPKFSDVVQIFGSKFISKYFDINSGVVDEAVVEVRLYESKGLSKDLLFGRRVGKITLLGDNLELLKDFNVN